MADPEVLFHTAKALVREAQRALDAPRPDEHPMWDGTIGYTYFVDEYNRLAKLTIEQFGSEAEEVLPLIKMNESKRNPYDVPGPQWRGYQQLATNRLAALKAFLQSKVSAPEREIDSLIDLIGMNLRAALFDTPEQEKEVQNALEVIFRARSLNFEREVVSISYSSKSFIPDFTFDNLDLALEVKLCKSEKKKKRIIDEINADIPAYQTEFRRALFVVFDTGYIRNVHKFKGSIEDNPDVHVMVVKE